MSSVAPAESGSTSRQRDWGSQVLRLPGRGFKDLGMLSFESLMALDSGLGNDHLTIWIEAVWTHGLVFEWLLSSKPQALSLHERSSSLYYDSIIEQHLSGTLPHRE